MQSTKEGKIFKTVEKSRERDCETSLEGIGYKMLEFGEHTEIQRSKPRYELIGCD